MKKTILSLIAVFFMASCGGGGGSDSDSDSNNNSDNNGSSVLKSNLGISFANIDSFIVGSGSVSSSSVKVSDVSSTDSSQLYVVLSDNTLQQVSLADGSYEVLGVVDTDTYTFFSVSGVTYNGTDCKLIPVRKSDGAMFCLDVNLHNNDNNYFQNTSIQKVLSSDVFYVWTGNTCLDSDSSIIKLDLTDPNNATQSTPFNLSDRGVRDFNINSSGDALVWSDGSTDGYIQVFKAGGGIVNVQPYYNYSFAYLSSGAQGYSHQDDFYLIISDLFFLPKTTNFVKETVVGQSVSLACGLRDAIKLLGKSFLLPGCTATAFYELAQDTGGVTVEHASAVITNVTGIYGVIDRIYVLGTDDFGNGGVVYYDINDDTWTTVLTPGDYTVSKMQVNASGDVLFYGVRNSDGATVMGKVFSSGSLTIISENTDMNVQSIIRIN